MPRILVCDDEPAIRETIQDLLESLGNEIVLACDGREGLARLQESRYDLILSDISMPGMNGIQLLQEAEKIDPAMHRVLLTAHTLEEYIDQLLNSNLSCVLTKSVPFPVLELTSTVQSLLAGKIFGVDRHVPCPIDHGHLRIHTHAGINETCEQLLLLAPSSRRTQLHTVLSEILTNAVYYGARGERGDIKETWNREFYLEDSQAIDIHWARNEYMAAISVTDQGGKLDRHTVLHWLNRQMSRDENGLPVGIFDNHGRGFFISRSFMDRLAISIERNKRCEVTLIMHLQYAPVGEKPLMILEI